MKITYKGDYALKAILDLSLHYGEGVVTIQELAKRADMPIKFLEQVLLELKRGGFVESKRGKVGGYRLAQMPSAIKVGAVIRFIEGALEPIACVESGYVGCKDIYNCVFREIWNEVAFATSAIVNTVTFEDLVSKIKNKTSAINYVI